METKLKPCPFCGGEGQLQGMTPENGGDRRHFVHCRSCGADGPWFKVVASAVKGWNGRAPGPKTAEMVAYCKIEYADNGHVWDEKAGKIVKDFIDEIEGQGVPR